MKTIINPSKSDWQFLVKRPELDANNLNDAVREILEAVKVNGDDALREYSLKFDGVKTDAIQVTVGEINIAIQSISIQLKEAIQLAHNNIYTFHKAQQRNEEVVETTPGVLCWRKSVGIEKVGLYIPGGSAPLFSTILMLGIPAKIAGCQEVVLCTPPSKDGTIHPAILFTANLVGITKIFKVGGAQAIAAMGYGTQTIPQTYKIFGPGNQYVTKAKELIQLSGVAIDMPAGPSEVLVIADETCNPVFVAADLLSQAEHGADSQVILVTDNLEVAKQCMAELEVQLKALPRVDLASKALENSWVFVFENNDDSLAFSNLYAPEHLILASEKAETWLSKIVNAGSVFIGNYSCESAGDYASGTNHTLPTNGFATAYSGVSLDSFVKKITFQKLTKEGIQNIGKAIEIMAEAEELFAHKNAVTLRLKSLDND